MASLGLPEGFEVFHNVKDVDDIDDDLSLGSVGDMSLLTIGSTLEHTLDENSHEKGDGNKEEENIDKKEGDHAFHHENKKENEDEVEEDSKPAAMNEESHPSSEPRMVSAESMVTVRHGNVNKPPPPAKPASQTPYDSLKDLVKKKQNKRQLTGNLLQNANIGNSGSNGMVSRPSTFLRAALYGQPAAVPQANQEFSQQPNKKAKMEDAEVTNPLLHKACMKRGADAAVIQSLLKIDKNLASTAHQIYQAKDVYDCVTYKFRESKVKEKYTYPLNIGICNRIQPAAIELLIQASPQVAALADGSMKESSICILLQHFPQDERLANVMLSTMPSCARTRDRHQNTPLHVACRFGATLGTVKYLISLYPQALHVRNKFGLTPIEVAHRSIVCSNHIANYLLGKQRGMF